MEIYRCHGFFAMSEMDDGLILLQGSSPLNLELAEILANGVLMKLGRNQKVVSIEDKSSDVVTTWFMFHIRLEDKP